MLDYAVKLTRTPGKVDEGDVAGLRDAGFDDVAILDICQIVCYYNYVNRLADGLGVELEDGWETGALTLTPSEFKSHRRTSRMRRALRAPVLPRQGCPDSCDRHAAEGVEREGLRIPGPED